MAEASSDRVQTLDRVVDILRCFTPERPLLSYSQIVAATGLSKATAHRLLQAMEANGLVRRTRKGGAYALGYQMLRWASIAQQSVDVRALARPLLEDLARQTGETAVLMIRDGDRALCLDRVDSPQALRLAMQIGDRIHLHAGSSAKVLMAYLAPEEIERVLAEEGLPSFGANTITEPARLRDELAQIRRQGYATSTEERDPGTAGVTAPVFDSAGDLVAALGLVGPLTRIDAAALSSLIPTVAAAAARLSAQLGYNI